MTLHRCVMISVITLTVVTRRRRYSLVSLSFPGQIIGHSVLWLVNFGMEMFSVVV